MISETFTTCVCLLAVFWSQIHQTGLLKSGKTTYRLYIISMQTTVGSKSLKLLVNLLFFFNILVQYNTKVFIANIMVRMKSRVLEK